MSILNLTNSEFFHEPYPHIVFNNVLSESFFKEIIRDFPADNEIEEFACVMGGRRRLNSDEIEFYRFLQDKPTWAQLFDAFDSAHFASEVVGRFLNEINSNQCVINPYNFRFRKGYQQSKAAKYSELKSGKIAISKYSPKQIIHKLTSRCLNRLRHLHVAMKNFLTEPEIYLEMDISAAGVGYSREIHRDSDKRIAAAVFYLNDADTIEGGDFVMHEFKQSSFQDQYPPQPHPNDTHILKTIRPKKNTLLLFLSTERSYHSVSCITSAQDLRRFLYLGLTVAGTTAWSGRDGRWR